MYLKSLDLHGFKSFADKTHLEFHPGVTGIVGPNGCGKSNVVDAVRWVLGETSAKALRGSEMADVIFSGTDKRKPMGMAEVTLTFADCEEALKVEFNEVSVGRRVYRDGRSEYLINNKACRLKDIQDLFMDTGIGRTSYSIMAQGQIDMLLSSKPEDRRMVFEEAAGITKFKKQKKETLRKLEYTEANLLRLTDILAEVKRQMNSLQRQAAKARRYQTLLEDVRVLDTHWSYKQFTELAAQKAEIDTNIASLRRQLAVHERELEGSETALETARARLAELDHELGEARHALNERRNRIQSSHARILGNEERAAEWSEIIRTNESDIAATEGKLNQQQMDLLLADESLEGLITRIESLRSDLEAATTTLVEIREQRKSIAADVAARRNQANAAESRLAGLLARIESLHAQRRADEERARGLATDVARQEETRAAQNAALEEVEASRAEFEAKLRDSRAALDDADLQLRQTTATLASAREELSKTRRTHDEKDARLSVLNALISSGEGLEGGTRAILQQGEDGGVRGLMAQFLEVPGEFVAAVEAALGPRLEAVLVRDGDTAARHIEALRDNTTGHAALTAGDLMPRQGGGQMLTVPEGATGWALDKVRLLPDARDFFEAALRQVLIVPDLATARRMRTEMPDVTFATLAGETLTPDGLLTGGSRGEAGASILERRNEARSLTEELSILATAIAEAETRIATLVADQAKWTTETERLRAEVQRNAIEVSQLEGQASLLRRELEQLTSRLEQLVWERDKLNQRISEAGEDTGRMEEETVATRAELEDCRARVQDGESGLESLQVQEAEAANREAGLRTTLAVEQRSKSALEAQRKPMAERLAELGEMIERRRQEITALHGRIAATGEENEDLRASITQAERQAGEFEATAARLAEDRATQAEALRADDARLSHLRKEMHQTGEKVGREEVHSTQLELRLENLCETTRERHGIDLAAFEQDIHALKLSIESQRKARRRPRGENGEAATESEIEAVADALAESETEAAAEAESAADAMPNEDGPDWDFVQSVIGELRQRLEAMGPVNLDAIQEFEELEERHTFLDNQHNDLVTAKAELLDIIEHINKETRVRFVETFEQVRENFSAMFRTLFGERSQASLVLVDENDPLECGIEIIAKPPGKKLQSISLLSGGERSLTAVALLFSIYMVKPSPFCVLDELDAPLDETNIGRFLKVLDGFIDKSQFIIVTHSKRTMARADIMYGVTMEEFGVSKPVGMRLSNEDAADDGTANRPAEELTAADRTALRLDG